MLGGWLAWHKGLILIDGEQSEGVWAEPALPQAMPGPAARLLPPENEAASVSLVSVVHAVCLNLIFTAF